MGQKDHNITLDEMENAIVGSHGILAEVGRKIERSRRNKAAKALSTNKGVSMPTALSEVSIAPIGWDSVKRALEGFELKETLAAEEEAALGLTAFNMLNRAVLGDIDAEKFVLDRKGRKYGWGKEDTINHKGSGLTVIISKAEDGV